ncbi:hypothetical protein TNCV_3186021 [Trichonephila clavipes]|nr:hypothetical protein TNCV_3186021 [Trichonephila clavipes]
MESQGSSVQKNKTNRRYLFIDTKSIKNEIQNDILVSFYLWKIHDLSGKRELTNKSNLKKERRGEKEETLVFLIEKMSKEFPSRQA